MSNIPFEIPSPPSPPTPPLSRPLPPPLPTNVLTRHSQRTNDCFHHDTNFSTQPTIEINTPNTTQISPSTSGRKAGSQNYSDEDLNKLLDIIEEVEPIGSNHWAEVQERYNDYAVDKFRAIRDQDALRNKYDKMVNVKKPTGSASCPPLVRRSKHIARDIMAKVNAISIGSGQGEVNEEEISDPENMNTSGNEHGKRRRNTFGARRNKRITGRNGVKCDEDEAELISHVGEMSTAICSFLNSSSSERNGIGNVSEIKKIVQEEVRAELESTNQSIKELKEMIKIVIEKPRL